MRTARKEEKKFTHVRISMNKRKQWKYYRELKVVGSRPRPMPKLLGSYTPLPPGPFGAKGPRAWWSQLAAAADLESADSELQALQQPGMTETLPGRPQRGAVWDGIGRAGRWEQKTKESCLQLDTEYII